MCDVNKLNLQNMAVSSVDKNIDGLMHDNFTSDHPPCMPVDLGHARTTLLKYIHS